MGAQETKRFRENLGRKGGGGQKEGLDMDSACYRAGAAVAEGLAWGLDKLAGLFGSEKAPRKDAVSTADLTLFDKFQGQERAVEAIKTSIAAAVMRESMPPHTLLYGGPGLGKTTLAGIAAEVADLRFVPVHGGLVSGKGFVEIFMNSLYGKSLLFIDEIHALQGRDQELLYTVMEGGYVDLDGGRVPLPPVSVYGCTTHQGLLNRPLRERFGLAVHLEKYSEEILEKIGTQAAGCYHQEALDFLVCRSRGTPRILKNLICRANDFAVVAGKKGFTLEDAEKAAEIEGFDSAGFTKQDRTYLFALHEAGGAVGLGSLAATLGERKENVENEIEPFLIERGLVMRTGRGRTLTKKGVQHVAGE